MEQHFFYLEPAAFNVAPDTVFPCTCNGCNRNIVFKNGRIISYWEYNGKEIHWLNVIFCSDRCLLDSLPHMALFSA